MIIKQVIFFLVVHFVTAFVLKINAQDIVQQKDSLLATFTIQNGKVKEVRTDNEQFRASAQKSGEELVAVLDDFFANDTYRKTTRIKVQQHLLNVRLFLANEVMDSVSSVVYILEMPGIDSLNKKLKEGDFLKLESKPSKIPQQFFISQLNNQQLILVSVLSFLHKDAEAFKQRQRNINHYLDWLLKNIRSIKI